MIARRRRHFPWPGLKSPAKAIYRKPASKSCYCEPMIWVFAPNLGLQSRNPAISAPALRRTAESAKRGAGITGLQEPEYSYSPAPPRSDFPVEPSLFLAVHEMSLL